MQYNRNKFWSMNMFIFFVQNPMFHSPTRLELRFRSNYAELSLNQEFFDDLITSSSVRWTISNLLILSRILKVEGWFDSSRSTLLWMIWLFTDFTYSKHFWFEIKYCSDEEGDKVRCLMYMTRLAWLARLTEHL